MGCSIRRQTGCEPTATRFFVSLLLTEADLSEPEYGLLAAQVPIVQTALFIGAALLLFFVLAGINKRMAWCTLVGLLANPFVLQYVPLRLTEGLNASLLVLLTAVVTALSYHADTFARRISLIGIGSVLAGIMLVVRPANISLVLAWIAFCTFYFAVGSLREWKAKLAAAFAAVGGFALAVIPQVVINVTNFGKFTPFPADDLGAFQLKMGLRLIRYGTLNISPHGRRLRYPNPFFSKDEIVEHGYDLLWMRPGAFLALMFGHMFSSVDYDHFFTFIHDLHPPYAIWLNAFNHVLLFSAAVVAVCFLVKRLREFWQQRSLHLADGLWLFLLIAAVSTFGLNSLINAEVRFGLAVTCLAGPLGVYGFTQWWDSPKLTKLKLLGACALYLALALAFSQWMLSLALSKLNSL